MRAADKARRRGAGQIRKLTILGDGAVWIRHLASQHFPQATQVIDLYPPVSCAPRADN
jgi:hypothetical protein